MTKIIEQQQQQTPQELVNKENTHLSEMQRLE